MKRNDCDDFPDTEIIGSSALYYLAKGAMKNADIIYYFLLLLQTPRVVRYVTQMTLVRY